jgi:hypothetical protein
MQTCFSPVLDQSVTVHQPVLELPTANCQLPTAYLSLSDRSGRLREQDVSAPSHRGWQCMFLVSPKKFQHFCNHMIVSNLILIVVVLLTICGGGTFAISSCYLYFQFGS